MPDYLVAESESLKEREQRRQRAGKSSGESYAATLQQMRPGARVTRVTPADDDAEAMPADAIARFDAVFITGSPMHVYDETPQTRRQLDFMRTVFASGTPSFGSCAGLQVAVAAAGGRVRAMAQPMEAGIARRITATDAGRSHPLLAGRPPAWDAPAIHTDEVDTLPPGAVLLAGNAATQVQAAEIRHDRGIFWGVQYHPELAPGEIASALRRQQDSLIERGLAQDAADVEAVARLLDVLQHDSGDGVARWRLGIDDSFADEARRRTEIENFLHHAPQLRGG